MRQFCWHKLSGTDGIFRSEHVTKHCPVLHVAVCAGGTELLRLYSGLMS